MRMREQVKREPTATPKRELARDTLTIRHILVPLDFSGQSRQALISAVPLARKHHARISLVHVVQPITVSAWRGFPGDGQYLGMDMCQIVEAAKAHLDELATQLLPEAVRGRAIVREGPAAYTVISVAKAIKADLIVLSTIGRSGLKRVLLGSTAERIVRHAHCPVLTVRRQANESAMPKKPIYPKRLPWRRILVPLDLSMTSLGALKMAVVLAKESGARLLLLNVIEPSPYATGMEGAVLLLPEVKVEQNAKKQLPQVARRFVPPSVPTTCLIRRGRAANEIVATADGKRVDLIVLSTYGHTGVDRLLMGSTAEHVVRTAQCPVFVVRQTKNL